MSSGHGNQPDRDSAAAGGALNASASPARTSIQEGDAALRRRVGGWALAALLRGNRSQVTWAESVGVSKSFAQRWLTGAQPLPVEAIARSAAEFPEVVQYVAAELAALVGMELRPVAHEDAHPRSLTDVIVELGDVLRAAAEGERDGVLSPDDIDRELAEWSDVDRVMSSRVAYLRRLKSERGGVVRAIGTKER
jgi:hypothetical protein